MNEHYEYMHAQTNQTIFRLYFEWLQSPDAAASFIEIVMLRFFCIAHPRHTVMSQVYLKQKHPGVREVQMSPIALDDAPVATPRGPIQRCKEQ